jgi:2-iminoacetate synthase ThiH
VLEALYERGQRTLPGGGAEILATRVRKRISIKKGGPEAWLDVHREAHRAGMRSTATMMYGHVETDAELIEHLDYVARLQDETHGFTAFVPWSYKRGNTPMESKVKHVAGARATCACSRRRGSTSTTSTTFRPRGSARARRPARSRSTSAPTTSAARCSRRTSTSPPGT